MVRIVFPRRPAGIEDLATGWRHEGGVCGRPVDVITGRDGALYVSDNHGGQIAFRPR